MKFYTGQHKFSCGVDLAARTMFLCVLDERGYPLLEKNIKTDPEILLKAIAPTRSPCCCAGACSPSPTSTRPRCAPPAPHPNLALTGRLRKEFSHYLE